MKRFLTASDVADAFGAGVSSVKRWCGLGSLRVTRTAGGHRRIVAGDVIQFARTDHRTILNPEPLGLAPSCDLTQPLDLDEGASLLATALPDGAESEAFEIVLRLYMSGCSLGCICDEAITPSFKCIGDGWIDGRVAMYEERRACEFCLSILNTMRTVLPRVPSEAPLAAGCTPPGDPYSLPTTMVEVGLIEAGWHACTIGRCVPFDAMQSAVESLRPVLFWLSASTVTDGFPFARHARQLPDYACFNHSAHVTRGVSCVSCHGRVDQTGGQRFTRDWSDFDRFASQHFAALRKRNGKGLFLLSEATSSPTFHRLLAKLQEQYPEAVCLEYESVFRDNERSGSQLGFGRVLRPHYDLDRARVVACLDADPLGMHPAATRHVRDWAAHRDPDSGSFFTRPPPCSPGAHPAQRQPHNHAPDP